MSIRDEAFNQPLFGCNNLTFNVAPQTNWGNGLAFSVKFEFRNGGAQTFLRLFWKVMSGVNECRNAPGRSFLLLFTRSGRSRSRRDPFHLLGPIRLLRLRGPLGPHLHLHRAALHAHHRTAPLHLSRSPCPSTTPCPPTTPSPTHRRPLPTTLTTLPLLPMTLIVHTLPRLLRLPRLMTPAAPTLRLLLLRRTTPIVLILPLLRLRRLLRRTIPTVPTRRRAPTTLLPMTPTALTLLRPLPRRTTPTDRTRRRALTTRPRTTRASPTHRLLPRPTTPRPRPACLLHRSPTTRVSPTHLLHTRRANPTRPLLPRLTPARGTRLLPTIRASPTLPTSRTRSARSRITRLVVFVLVGTNSHYWIVFIMNSVNSFSLTAPSPSASAALIISSSSSSFTSTPSSRAIFFKSLDRMLPFAATSNSLNREAASHLFYNSNQREDPLQPPRSRVSGRWGNRSRGSPDPPYRPGAGEPGCSYPCRPCCQSSF